MLWISAVENVDLSIFPSEMNIGAKLKIKQKIQFKKKKSWTLVESSGGFKKILCLFQQMG
jgi:hypothetical protein